MSTMQDIVDKAFRDIGVASEDESVSDNMLTNAVEAANFMASGWKAVGIDVSWTDKVSTDTFPLDDQYRNAFSTLLANDRAGAYDVAPPEYTAVKDAWEVFEQNFKTTPTMATPSGLKRMPSQYWGYGARDE